MMIIVLVIAITEIAMISTTTIVMMIGILMTVFAFEIVVSTLASMRSIVGVETGRRTLSSMRKVW